MIRSILLPIDLNHESSWNTALPQALALARDNAAALHVLTVIPDYGMSIVGAYFPKGFSETATTQTLKALEEFVAAHVPDDVKVTTHVLHGPIYKEIIAAAASVSADVIVMASHRPEMQDYLLGPNASRVVRHAPQSVFVVRSGR
jgi:nucleotide-binding universal stress UspA family protein